MKRPIFVLALFLVFFTPFLHAEDTAPERIPRRVHFTVEGRPLSGPDSILLKTVPAMLYQAVSSRKAILRVPSEKNCHNICITRFSGSGGSDSNIEISLIELTSDGEETQFSSSYEYDGDLEGLEKFIQGAADRMAGNLDFVEPKVEIVTRVVAEEEKTIVREIGFNEQLKRPWEFTIRLGGLTKDIISFRGWGADIVRFGFFPLQLDAALYPAAGKHGIVFSFMTDYVDGNGDGGKDWFLLPGLGYMFRSFGRLSAGFNTTYSAGVYLPGGTPIFFMLLNFTPVITFNITPALAITMRIGNITLEPTLIGSKTFVPDDVLRRNKLFLQIVNIGFMFRPRIASDNDR